MNEYVRFHAPVAEDPAHRLLEEIAFFESRLIEIGHSGDCAYEKALARNYVSRLAECREALANLLREGERRQGSETCTLVAQQKTP